MAFAHPESIEISGPMISGAVNTVRVRVASLSDFIILKAHAVDGRDKPKDVYDLCFCLDEYPGGIEALAADWRERCGERFVDASIAILAEKFQSVGHYGPRQLAVFHQSGSPDEGPMHARRAFELVGKLLRLLA